MVIRYDEKGRVTARVPVEAHSNTLVEGRGTSVCWQPASEKEPVVCVAKAIDGNVRQFLFTNGVVRGCESDFEKLPPIHVANNNGRAILVTRYDEKGWATASVPIEADADALVGGHGPTICWRSLVEET